MGAGGGTDWEPPVERRRDREQEEEAPKAPDVHAARHWVGLLVTIALVINVIAAVARIGDLTAAEGTVFQALQIYAEHILYAATAIGIAVGVYVWSRWRE